MIILSRNATFDAPVEITFPGLKEPVEATFTFRAPDLKRRISLLVLTRSIKRNVLQRWREYLALCWRVKKPANAADMLDELITGWQGFDIPYSKRALRMLIEESPGVSRNIFFAYIAEAEKARIKN